MADAPDLKTNSNVLDSVRNLVYIALGVFALVQGYITVHDKQTKLEHDIVIIRNDVDRIKADIETNTISISDGDYRVNFYHEK